jgi:hypothetical protein
MLLGAAILFERPAYAYVDPGNGLLAIQAAGSALVATGWYLRRKIFAFLRRSPNVKQGSESTGNAPEVENSPRS